MLAYKILTQQEFDAIAHLLPRPDAPTDSAAATELWHGTALDRNDGFIHLSVAFQAAGVAARYFATTNSLHILVIDTNDIAASIKWEDPAMPGEHNWANSALNGRSIRAGYRGFPHIYGGLDLSVVRRVIVATKPADSEPWSLWFPVPCDVLVAVDESDRIVAAVRIFERSMHLGPYGTVRVGGIGEVGTHPDHRSRGLATMLLQLANSHLKQSNYPLALLHTNPASHAFKIYKAAGWISWPMSKHSWTLAPSSSTFASSQTLQPLTPSRRIATLDQAAESVQNLANLHQKSVKRCLGPLVRPSTDHWLSWIFSRSDSARIEYIVRETTSGPYAYIIISRYTASPTLLTINEVFVDSLTGFEAGALAAQLVLTVIRQDLQLAHQHQNISLGFCDGLVHDHLMQRGFLETLQESFDVAKKTTTTSADTDNKDNSNAAPFVDDGWMIKLPTGTLSLKSTDAQQGGSDLLLQDETTLLELLLSLEKRGYPRLFLHTDSF
eukprot:jgi/Hompol1/4070/HPOL_000901-RA